MVGAELTFNALPGFLGGVSLKQMALWSFNSTDDGIAGRSVASLDFAPDLGIFRPHSAPISAASTATACRPASSPGRRSASTSP